MLKFMEKHPGLAKGFYRGDRVVGEQLWNELAKELNSIGPPQKDSPGWKKAWADWKACIRKKLSENRAETTATGGGPNNMQHISSKDDAVAKLCGLYTAVEGIKGVQSFGVTRKEPNESIELENINVDSLADTFLEELPDEISEPKRKVRRVEPTQHNLHDFMRNQITTNEQICTIFQDVSNVSKSILKEQKEISKNIYKMRKALESLTAVIKEKKEEEHIYHNEKMKEIKRNNFEVEKCLKKKQEMKIKELELEIERNSFLKK